MGQNKRPTGNIPICCGVLERLNIGWMRLLDGTLCMPYIDGHSDDNRYRINNCPSCGTYIREIMVENGIPNNKQTKHT